MGTQIRGPQTSDSQARDSLTASLTGAMQSKNGVTRLVGNFATGKTELVRAVGAELARGESVDCVLGLVPTRRAARSWQVFTAERIGVAHDVVTPFAFARRVLAGATDFRDIRLLTAPEQEDIVRDLLRNGELPTSWPSDWRVAVNSDDFVKHLRRAIAHLRMLGHDPQQVANWAVESGSPHWQAIAEFTGQYLDVLDWREATDYVELLNRAIWRLASAEKDMHLPWQFLLVDDAHQFDAGQWRLVQALAQAMNHTVVAGNPLMAADDFRGSRPDLFRLGPVLPRDAETEVLSTTRLHPRVRDLVAASQLSSAGLQLSTAEGSALSAPSAADTPMALTGVACDDPSSLLSYLAQGMWESRRSGVSWDEMSVQCVDRSQVELVERALRLYGIPTRLDRSLPLGQHPGAQQLLQFLQLALADSEPPAEDILAVLHSPLFNVSALDCRPLAVALQSGTVSGSELVNGTADLEALALAPPVKAELMRLIRLVGELVNEVDKVGLGELFWRIWAGPNSNSHWRRQLEKLARAGSRDGERARGELISVANLIELAERRQTSPPSRVKSLDFCFELISSRVLMQPNANKQDSQAVAVGTAHVLSQHVWEHVAVYGTHDQRWWTGQPQHDLVPLVQLTESGLQPNLEAVNTTGPIAQTIARCRRTLWFGAVGKPATGSIAHTHHAHAARIADSDQQLLADLRDGLASSEPKTRWRAGTLLHRIIDCSVPRVSWAADPWLAKGAREWTRNSATLRPVDSPISLSPSGLQSLSRCPQRWFWEREAGAGEESSSAAGLGTLVHEVAAATATNSAPSDELEKAVATARQMYADEGEWYANLQGERTKESLGRLTAWLANQRIVGAEQAFDVVLPVEGDQVRLRGSIDLVADAPSGTAYVWDIKTRKSPASKKEVAEDVQLAAYQAALTGQGAAVEGAGILHAAVPAGTRSQHLPKERNQSANDARAVFTEAATAAVGHIRAEEFPAKSGAWCRTCPVAQLCTKGRGA